MTTQQVIDLLVEKGVLFQDRPTRAHHRIQGGIRTTLLCLEFLERGGTRIEHECPCTYNGRTYLEIELCDTDRLIHGVEINEDPDFINRLKVRYNKESKQPKVAK